jgi:hypothetical protein
MWEPLDSNPSSTCPIVHAIVSPRTSEPEGTKHAGMRACPVGRMAPPYDNRDTKIALPQIDECGICWTLPEARSQRSARKSQRLNAQVKARVTFAHASTRMEIPPASREVGPPANRLCLERKRDVLGYKETGRAMCFPKESGRTGEPSAGAVRLEDVRDRNARRRQQNRGSWRTK